MFRTERKKETGEKVSFLPGEDVLAFATSSSHLSLLQLSISIFAEVDLSCVDLGVARSANWAIKPGVFACVDEQVVDLRDVKAREVSVIQSAVPLLPWYSQSRQHSRP